MVTRLFRSSVHGPRDSTGKLLPSGNTPGCMSRRLGLANQCDDELIRTLDAGNEEPAARPAQPEHQTHPAERSITEFHGKTRETGRV